MGAQTPAVRIAIYESQERAPPHHRVFPVVFYRKAVELVRFYECCL